MVALLVLGYRIREWRKPTDGEASEHRLNAFPPRLLVPPSLLFLQLLDARFVVPNGGDLGTQHDHSENRE